MELYRNERAANSSVNIATHKRTGQQQEEAPLLGRKRPRYNNKKWVRFSSPIVTSTRETPAAIITQEEAIIRWYQQLELALFKVNAKDFMLGGYTYNPNNAETTRGLERYNVDRVMNKSLVVKTTLKAAMKKNISSETLANFAQQCSSRARNVAFQIGCQDFCEVYHPEMVGLLSNMNMDMVAASQS